MNAPRQPSATALWAALGVGSGLMGLALSYAFEMIVTLQRPLVSVVASMVRPWVPEHAHEVVVKYLGLHDHSALLLLLVVLGAAGSAAAGVLARRSLRAALALLTVLATAVLVAVLTQTPAHWNNLLGLLIGWLSAVGTLALFTRLLRPSDRSLPAPAAELATGAAEGHSAPPVDDALVVRRRTVVSAVVSMTLVGGTAAVVGGSIGRRRRRTAAARALVRLPRMTRGIVPAGAQAAGVEAAAWGTGTADFFVRDTVLRTPTIDPDAWELRVHGLVEREVRLSYADLVALPLVEQWTTLVCAEADQNSHQLGNAWWSGARVLDVLQRAGLRPEADLVVQTSHDGWTCRTPLGALTRDEAAPALLVYGMNGDPLPLEHGFPVRTVVPGLVGDVSACKWVVDLEVTSHARLAAQQASEDDEVESTERGSASAVPAGIRLDAVTRGQHGRVQVAGTVWGADVAGLDVAVQVLPEQGTAGEGRAHPAQVLPGPEGTWRHFTADLTLPRGEPWVTAWATGPGVQVSADSQLRVPERPERN